MRFNYGGWSHNLIYIAKRLKMVIFRERIWESGRARVEGEDHCINPGKGWMEPEGRKILL